MERKNNQRLSIPDIKGRKNREPVVCLTAYTAPMARILDRHADLLLVGDSLGNVLYGLENTLAVDLEMMIRHGQAVMRSAQKACVIVDMPFGTYEESQEQAYRNAMRVMKETGCDGVKLEGGEHMAPTIQYLTSRNIPVMAHIGLLPQSVLKDGGYKVKGKTLDEETRLIADAKTIEKAGAFAVVIEGTVEDVSAKITKAISIPTIGIGASAACDGQVLVAEDMLGMLEGHTPKFVKKYAQLAEQIENAAATYASEVRARVFPGETQVYTRPRIVAKQDKVS
jgi:3-methyl-2-oxobutanoate hydroxymethyltransferase